MLNGKGNKQTKLEVKKMTIKFFNKLINKEIVDLRDPKKNPTGYKRWQAKDDHKAYKGVISWFSGFAVR